MPTPTPTPENSNSNFDFDFDFYFLDRRLEDIQNALRRHRMGSRLGLSEREAAEAVTVLDVVRKYLKTHLLDASDSDSDSDSDSGASYDPSEAQGAPAAPAPQPDGEEQLQLEPEAPRFRYVGEQFWAVTGVLTVESSRRSSGMDRTVLVESENFPTIAEAEEALLMNWSSQAHTAKLTSVKAIELPHSLIVRTMLMSMRGVSEAKPAPTRARTREGASER